MKRAVAIIFLLIGALPNAKLWGATHAGATRMITTHMAQSAPLNLVNRWFARLEGTLDDSWSSERLTFESYRWAEIENHERTIAKLLTDISGGPSEVQILELSPVSPSESSIRQTLEQFLNSLSFRDGSEDAGAMIQKSFKAAVKAALTRPDVFIHSARILRTGGESRVLVLVDDETKDLVLLTLGRVTP